MVNKDLTPGKIFPVSSKKTLNMGVSGVE